MTATQRFPHGLIAGFAASFVLAGPLSADPYPIDQRVDVQHYRFALTLSDDSDVIDVDASIEIRVLDPALRQLSDALAGFQTCHSWHLYVEEHQIGTFAHEHVDSFETVSEAAGVLSIQVHEGETVAIGAVVATIDTAAAPKTAEPPPAA